MNPEAFNKAAELLGLDPDELAAKIDIPESPAKTIIDEAEEERKLRDRLVKHNSRVSKDGYSEPTLPNDETEDAWSKNLRKEIKAYEADRIGSNEKYDNDPYLKEFNEKHGLEFDNKQLEKHRKKFPNKKIKRKKK